MRPCRLVNLSQADRAPELQRARAMAHPLRQVLLFRYARDVTSPSKIAQALGEPVNLVSYHTRVLRQAGCVELVRVEPRRGAREHFYRAVGRGEIEDAEWERLPVSGRRWAVRRVLEDVWGEATEALPSGGMDDRTTHISRQVLSLDDRGRLELAALLRATVDAAVEIERASRARGGDAESPAELVILQFMRASAP
jgi:DNA-binding transcriptional ArsR family regulator